MTAVLIDTNVFVYAHDRNAVAKQAQAIRVLDHLHAAGSGRLSVQCLGEFFRVVTRPPKPMLAISEAMEQVQRLARAWTILDLTSFVVLEAMRGVRDYQLAYWDAQIWATALLNQVPVVFSEDFNANSVLEGVRFVNPFASDFILSAWG